MSDSSFYINSNFFLPPYFTLEPKSVKVYSDKIYTVEEFVGHKNPRPGGYFSEVEFSKDFLIWTSTFPDENGAQVVNRTVMRGSFTLSGNELISGIISSLVAVESRYGDIDGKVLSRPISVVFSEFGVFSQKFFDDDGVKITSLGEYSRFFPQGWANRPFEDNLISVGSTSDSSESSSGGSTSTSVQSGVNPMTTITPSTRQVNEGDSLSTTLSGFTPNSTLFFSVTGRGIINKKDFSAGAVKSSIRVDSNGVATISHTLRADKATEGEESFVIQVFSDKKMRNSLGQSDAVTVFDTSMKAGKRPKNNTVAVENSNNSDNARTYRDIGSLAVRAWTKGVDRITGQGGEIVYGGAKNDVLTGLSKISNNGEWIIPSFLSGGLGNDQYIVTQGAFVVIMDAGGGKDTVSAPSMNINNIEFIRINQRDIYATDGNTSVLLVDPQGLQGDQYKLENFVIGKNRYSLAQLTKIAEQSSYFGGDYTYSQLQSLGGLNPSEVGMNPLKINDYMTDALFNNSIV